MNHNGINRFIEFAFRCISTFVLYFIYRFIDLLFNKFGFPNYLSIITFIMISIFYFVFIDKKYMAKKYYSKIKLLKPVEFLLFIKSDLIIPLSLIFGFGSLITFLSNPYEYNYFIWGVFLLSIILGLQTRMSINRVINSLYLQYKRKNYIIYFLLTLMIMILVYISLQGTEYVPILISGISFGIFITHVRLFLKYKQFKNYLHNAQDYFLINEYNNMDKSSLLYRPCKCYFKNKLKESIKIISFLEKRINDLNQTQKITLFHLKFRIYLKLGEYDKACELMQNLCDKFKDGDLERGWYLQQQQKR